jgi:hypothetical protein
MSVGRIEPWASELRGRGCGTSLSSVIINWEFLIAVSLTGLVFHKKLYPFESQALKSQNFPTKVITIDSDFSVNFTQTTLNPGLECQDAVKWPRK